MCHSIIRASLGPPRLQSLGQQRGTRNTLLRNLRYSSCNSWTGCLNPMRALDTSSCRHNTVCLLRCPIFHNKHASSPNAKTSKGPASLHSWPVWCSVRRRILLYSTATSHWALSCRIRMPQYSLLWRYTSRSLSFCTRSRRYTLCKASCFQSSPSEWKQINGLEEVLAHLR